MNWRNYDSVWATQNSYTVLGRTKGIRKYGNYYWNNRELHAPLTDHQFEKILSTYGQIEVSMNEDNFRRPKMFLDITRWQTRKQSLESVTTIKFWDMKRLRTTLSVCSYTLMRSAPQELAIKILQCSWRLLMQFRLENSRILIYKL